MRKSIKVKRLKSKNNHCCTDCYNAMYVGEGGYICDALSEMPLVMDDFVPTDDFLACNGKKYEKI